MTVITVIIRMTNSSWRWWDRLVAFASASSAVSIRSKSEQSLACACGIEAEKKGWKGKTEIMKGRYECMNNRISAITTITTAIVAFVVVLQKTSTLNKFTNTTSSESGLQAGSTRTSTSWSIVGQEGRLKTHKRKKELRTGNSSRSNHHKMNQWQKKPTAAHLTQQPVAQQLKQPWLADVNRYCAVRFGIYNLRIISLLQDGLYCELGQSATWSESSNVLWVLAPVEVSLAWYGLHLKTRAFSK